MTDWKLVRIYTTNIIRITEKAALSAMPAKSKYAGYTFWFPKKLIRSGVCSNELNLSVNTDMKFNLKKQSTKTFKTLSECCISAEELIEIFGEGIDINPKLIDRVKNAVTITTHQPPALDVPSEVTIDETLIR